MAKYRKLPVEIEAWEFQINSPEEFESTLEYISPPDWLKEAFRAGMIKVGGAFCSAGDLPPEISIMTLEGVMTASIGDYIIQGVKGELYPCKPDIFEATYEKA